MAADAALYRQGFEDFKNGDLDWTAGTVRAALLTSAYTPNLDTHTHFDDITNEVSAGGAYASGGEVVANRGVTVGARVVRGTGDDVEWPSSTITARYAVVYQDTGTASSSTLVGLVDFGEDRSSEDGMFAIRWTGGNVFETTLDNLA